MCAKITRREKSPEQALSSLMALCARGEKSSGDAIRLMSSWGVGEADQQQILEQLLHERFIDDERYATLYIREKTHLSGWGIYKLRAALQRKGIAKEIIDEKLSQLDHEAMGEKLLSLITKRARTVKYTTKYQLRDKLIRYGASLGYDFESVNEAVHTLIEEDFR